MKSIIKIANLLLLPTNQPSVRIVCRYKHILKCNRLSCQPSKIQVGQTYSRTHIILTTEKQFLYTTVDAKQGGILQTHSSR